MLRRGNAQDTPAGGEQPAEIEQPPEPVQPADKVIAEEVRDANGQLVRRIEYDADLRVKQQSEYDEHGESLRTEYTYDENGNRTASYHKRRNEEDENGNPVLGELREFKRETTNAEGKLVSRQTMNFVGDVATNQEFNADGTSRTRFNNVRAVGRVEQARFDAEGRTTFVSTADGRQFQKQPNGTFKITPGDTVVRDVSVDENGVLQYSLGRDGRKEFAIKVKETPTGQISLLEDGKERPLKVLSSAERNMSAEDYRRFRDNILAIEQRAHQEGLPKSEVEATHHELLRLIEAREGHTSRENRLLAASSFAHHLADPSNIDQGDYHTCAASTTQERLMTRNPAKAAEMLTSACLTGKWTAKDGKVIEIRGDQSFTPRPESRTSPPADGERSYATQVLNLVMNNDLNQRKHPPRYYVQGRPDGAGDSGERLLDKHGHGGGR